MKEDEPEAPTAASAFAVALNVFNGILGTSFQTLTEIKAYLDANPDARKHFEHFIGRRRPPAPNCRPRRRPRRRPPIWQITR